MISLTQSRRGISFCVSFVIALSIIFLLTVFINPERIHFSDAQLNWSNTGAKAHAQDAQLIADNHHIESTTSLPIPWEFNPRKHERSFGLSVTQCSSAFPDFFKEIERAVQYRNDMKLGKVTKDMIDISWRKDEIIRCLIYEGQLYIIDAKWSPYGWDVSRALALLHSMHRALITSPETDAPIPNIEFAINLRDWPEDPEEKHPQWVLSRPVDRQEQTWVMPDFGYWSWPEDIIGEYSKIRREIRENEPAWHKKHNKAVWRGAATTNNLRLNLLNVTQGQTWADVKPIDWADKEQMKRDALTVSEHCDYRYVIHTEGHSYSGRGKYLLTCNSVSIVHKPEWVEPHSHLFVSDGPDQNIVSVERNFANLASEIQKLSEDQDLARRIAANSARVFRDRYLTPAAQACYWRRLFRAWRSVSFEPELYQTVKMNGKKRKIVRGKTYETFVSNLLLPAE